MADDVIDAKARRVAAAIALEHYQCHQQSVWSDGMLRSAARLIAESLREHPSDDEIPGRGYDDAPTDPHHGGKIWRE